MTHLRLPLCRLWPTFCRTLVTPAFALALAWAPIPVHAQRAAEFHQRVKQYVVHDAPTIRIDDVRVIDGTGTPAVAGQSILIRDGKIIRIGPTESGAGSAADVVIDGKGRTVMPGLVMMHEH